MTPTPLTGHERCEEFKKYMAWKIDNISHSVKWTLKAPELFISLNIREHKNFPLEFPDSLFKDRTIVMKIEHTWPYITFEQWLDFQSSMNVIPKWEEFIDYTKRKLFEAVGIPAERERGLTFTYKNAMSFEHSEIMDNDKIQKVREILNVFVSPKEIDTYDPPKKEGTN